MLAALDSNRITFAIVFGIPLALAVLVAVGLSRKTPTAVLGVGALIVAGIIGLGVWSLYRGPTPQAAALAAGAAAGSPSTTAPPSATPTTSGPPATPPPGCQPNGTSLQEIALGTAFKSTCLAAPADTAFTIAFNNQDAGTAHTIHIFSANPAQDPNATSLFTGQVVTGPATVTYHVNALHAGTYFFHCDIHPAQMTGTFVVR